VGVKFLAETTTAVEKQRSPIVFHALPDPIVLDLHGVKPVGTALQAIVK